MNTFNIGDRVLYKNKPGTILYLDITLIYLVKFDIREPGYHTGSGKSNEDDCYWCALEDLHFLSIPLSKEERIAIKIKKLWNESKYIQHFPEQAY